MRLTFLCHAATRSMREGGFASADDPIDDGGSQKSARLPFRGARTRAISSPAIAAIQTAAILEIEPVIDDVLRDIDHGDWAGRRLTAIHADDPARLAAWIADPDDGAPGGESFGSVLARVEPWLSVQSAHDVPVLAITHPMVIRAALAVALDMPSGAVMRIDIAPLTVIELSFHRLWRLQAIRPA